LGMKIAQALSNEKVVMPEIQFRLSDSWLDEFENGSLTAGSDTERELFRRLLENSEQERKAGQWLTRRYNIESLFPYQLKQNENLDSKLNIVIMVNEMCASMCDIFAGIMQDNKLATIVGSRTVGAGGNVVNHPQAPNSKISVSQTESLILRRDGSYIENNGVTPDVVMPVVESSTSKYEAVRRKALEVLLKAIEAKKEATSTPTA